MFAVQPKPEGMNLRKVILTASPGSAPSMNTGPLTGLTLAKSTVATSATVEFRVKCPAPESMHSKWIVSPGLQMSAGAKSRLHAKLWFLRWIVWLQAMHMMASGRGEAGAHGARPEIRV
jgi:hypothetical protein